MNEPVAGAETNQKWVAGGYADDDEHAGEDLWNLEGRRTTHWEPESWHKSPEQLIEEARAKNNAAIEASLSMGGRHSNPPNTPTRMRPY
jgi:hypothetical protein